MFDYDDWKTSPPRDDRWEHYLTLSESLSNTQMRKELLESGAIESYDQKLKDKVFELWIEYKISLEG